jgi:hypothetical protein
MYYAIRSRVNKSIFLRHTPFIFQKAEGKIEL